MSQSKLEEIKEKVMHFFHQDPRLKVRNLSEQPVDKPSMQDLHQCPQCHKKFDDETHQANFFVCVHCQYHFRISAHTRFALLFDSGLYEDISIPPVYENPIQFPEYERKLQLSYEKTQEHEAVAVAVGKIAERDMVVACMSFAFLGGSMGTWVGESLLQALFTAAKQKIPCLLITASGGARMYEGLFSLMQMARTSHAIALLKKHHVPLFVLLSDPTTGGVTASFAMLGDVILAEPNALIGFAGPRVIEGTLKHKLPEGFQRAEFQLEKGFVDAIVHRSNIRKVIAYLIETHNIKGNDNE